MRKLLLLVFVVVCLYAWYHRDQPKTIDTSADHLAYPARSVDAPSDAEDDAEHSPSNYRERSVGDGGWGAGHQAGYDWAERNGIDDEEACDEAGDSHNSPSFAAGCKAYVNGDGPG